MRQSTRKGLAATRCPAGLRFLWNRLPPTRTMLGLWGPSLLRAVSGGAHGLTDCNVKQHAGLESRKGGEIGR